jgi:plastocyanin
MKIKVGQTVKFTADGLSTPADFNIHPIGRNGGDSGNSVTNVDTDTGELVLAEAGTFGFTCTIHFNMIGAFQVVD